MSDYVHLMWRPDRAKVKSYTTASRAKATLVTIQVEVTDGYTLSDIIRQLHDAQHPKVETPEPPAPKAGKKAEPRLALPAPAPRLSFRGDE